MFAKHRVHWLLVLLLSDAFLVKAQQDGEQDPPPPPNQDQQVGIINEAFSKLAQAGIDKAASLAREHGPKFVGQFIPDSKIMKSMLNWEDKDSSKPETEQGNTGDKSASGDLKPEAGDVKGNEGAKEVVKQGTGALGTKQEPLVGAKPNDPQPSPVVTDPKKSSWKPSLAYGIGGIFIGYAAGHFLRPSVDALLGRIKKVNSSDAENASKSSTDQSPSLFSKPLFIACVVAVVVLIGLALWCTKSLWWGEPKKETEKKESEQAKDTTTSKMGSSLKATDSAKTPGSSARPSSTARSSTGTRSPTSALSKPSKAATKGSPKSSMKAKPKGSPKASGAK